MKQKYSRIKKDNKKVKKNEMIKQREDEWELAWEWKKTKISKTMKVRVKMKDIK